MRKITILGTSHVAPESIRKIEASLEGKDCVAVEMDPGRYYALLHEGKKPVGGKDVGPFMRLLASVQKRLGKQTGVFPGHEMLYAIEKARARGVPVVLIDQDFSATVKDMRSIPIGEKFGLLMALFVVPFSSHIDLKKIPDRILITETLQFLRKKFPHLYRALVLKRNRYMGAWVKELAKKHKNLLVVVGAGHVEGLKKQLRGKRVKVV